MGVDRSGATSDCLNFLFKAVIDWQPKKLLTEAATLSDLQALNTRTVLPYLQTHWISQRVSRKGMRRELQPNNDEERSV